MTRLKHRIANAGTNQARAQGAYHPFGTSATPMVMPLAAVTYHPVQGYPFGVLAYESLHPQWNATGGEYAVTAARAQGAHIRVHSAGRP